MSQDRRLHLTIASPVLLTAAAQSPERQRVELLSKLYFEIGETVGQMRADVASDATLKPGELLKKLAELQTLHVMLLRAEEAFNDKFGQSESTDGIDLDALRHEIGGRLDRLRAINHPDGVPD